MCNTLTEKTKFSVANLVKLVTGNKSLLTESETEREEKNILNPSNINNAKLICRFLKEANATMYSQRSICSVQIYTSLSYVIYYC